MKGSLKRLACLLTALAWIVTLPAIASANDDDRHEGEDQCSKEIQWTQAQKATLNDLYGKLYKSQKDIIDKYVEYGALSKPEAEKRLSSLSKHIEYVKAHNYKWCSELEDDGEFEWYEREDGRHDD